MAASGLSDITAPMALAAGARGVGVGSAGESRRSVRSRSKGDFFFVVCRLATGRRCRSSTSAGGSERDLGLGLGFVAGKRAFF